MISLSAFLARSHGPRGFSLALMTTEPGGKCCRSRSTAAAASRGSFTIRKPETAAAAADHWRNARREPFRRVGLCLMRTSLDREKLHLALTTLAPNGGWRARSRRAFLGRQ